MGDRDPEPRPAILLLENDREVLFVLPPFLRRCGDLCVASDPAEARRLVRAARTQILVLASCFAREHGIAILRDMRGLEPCAQALVLCDRDAAEVPAAVIAEGIGDVLVKPFDVALVPPRIERLLEAMREQQREYARRRELESRLQHTDRIAMLGTLVATVAHELANPLAVLVGNGELMGDVLRGDAPISDEDRVFLRQAAEDSAKAATMMSEYLSRILRYAQKHAESWTVSSLREPIETAMLLVGKRAVSKLVAIHVGDLEACPAVRHHGIALTQAIVNALSNAIDATPKHGNVWITVEREGAEVAICIRDDGPGITPEQRRLFFEPFFTTKNGGTGLGAVVMRQVLEEHGGRVELSSDDTTPGLRVRLVLPADTHAPPGNG